MPDISDFEERIFARFQKIWERSCVTPSAFLHRDSSFRHPSAWAVAVSGGSDSLCLAKMLGEFSKISGCRVVALVVDHGLRSSSFQEAQWTKNILTSWGLETHILLWNPGVVPLGGIQQKARYSRYQLLTIACHSLGLGHLFVAHHQDDLLETCLIRKQAGSGWRGLAGMSSCTVWHGITILRPFLQERKELLQKILKEKNVTWIEDPSNQNFCYQRTRIRKDLQELSPLQRQDLFHEFLQHRYNRQRESLELGQTYTTEWGPLGYLKVPMTSLLDSVLLDQGAWILGHWIQSVSLQKTPLRMNTLVKLWPQLWKNASHPTMITTLGGCYIMKHQSNLFLFREGKRVVEKPLLQHNNCFLWDGRFFVEGRGGESGRQPSRGYKEKLMDFGVTPWQRKKILEGLPPESFDSRYVGCGIPYPLFLESLD